MTDIRLDPDSAVPPYEQVRLRIAALAAAGVYPAGHKLPPVRTLATDLGLAANTVARAYRELEQAGLVETRGRAGTVITARAAHTPAQAGLVETRGRAGTVITARAAHTPAQAQTAARTYVATVRALGIPDDQAVDLIRAALTDPR